MAETKTIKDPNTPKTVKRKAPAKTQAQKVSKVQRSLYYVGAEWDALRNAVEDYVDFETGEVKQDGADEIFAQIDKAKGDVNTKAVNAGMLYLELESEAERMKDMKKKLEKAIRTTEEKAEALKGSIALFMQSVGTDYVTDGFVKIGYHSSQSVEVYDESKLDEKYIRVKYEPDKIAIRDALKAGEDVPGAEMKTNTTLSIRT